MDNIVSLPVSYRTPPPAKPSPNVVPLGISRHDSMTVSQALGAAKDLELESVLILGYNKGGRPVTVFSRMEIRDALFRLKREEIHIMDGVE